MLVGGTCAQILLKLASQKALTDKSIVCLIKNILTNFYLLLGIAILLVDTVLIVILMRKIQLVYIMPFLSVIYVFVPLLSCAVLKESVNKFFWVGVILIVCGILISVS